MVIADFLLALVAAASVALTAAAQPYYYIQNTATGFVFEDAGTNSPGPTLGTPIIAAAYNKSRVKPQSWAWLSEGAAFSLFTNRTVGAGGSYAFVRAHADGLPGQKLVTQEYASEFSNEYPYGIGVRALVLASVAPKLAITAPRAANNALTLQPYNASDLYQHWAFFSVPPN